MSRRDSRDRTWLLRAGSGVGVLLAGLLVLAVGGAGSLTELFRAVGTPASTAHPLAVAIAGLVPPVVLVVVTRSLTSADRARTRAGYGAGIAGATAVGSVFLGAGGQAVATALLIGYALGIAVAVVGLFEGVSTDETGSTAGESVSWQATTRDRSPGPTAGVTPADGGSEDDDLDFPLDSDREPDDRE
jgi:hypothetical protein